MIHMELGPSTVLGVGLALVGLLLYLLRTRRPDVSRDYDLFFSSVGLLCGGILLFQGWRLDPILLLCQVLLSGTVIFFVGESLWLRSRKCPVQNLGVVEQRRMEAGPHQLPEPDSCDTLDLDWDYGSLRLMPPTIAIPGWEGIDCTPPIDYCSLPR